ncbi:MAG: DUF6125 family protein [Dehalococcoidia bacterium]
MTEFLNDYSGPFQPDFSHEKLSREALLRILKANSVYLRRLDATWYATVMKKRGNELAFECDAEIWERFINYELDVLCRTLDIRGNDVETVIKAIQSTPWMRMHNRTFELRDKNCAVITYRNCRTLLNLEKEGTHRYRQICHVLEPRLFQLTADYFNPRISVIPLQLPPREKGSDVCCRWEFRLEEKI